MPERPASWMNASSRIRIRPLALAAMAWSRAGPVSAEIARTEASKVPVSAAFVARPVSEARMSSRRRRVRPPGGSPSAWPSATVASIAASRRPPVRPGARVLRAGDPRERRRRRGRGGGGGGWRGGRRGPRAARHRGDRVGQRTRADHVVVAERVHPARAERCSVARLPRRARPGAPGSGRAARSARPPRAPRSARRGGAAAAAASPDSPKIPLRYVATSRGRSDVEAG